MPEPATIVIWSLLGAGGWLGLAVWRRRDTGRRPWSPETRRAISAKLLPGGRAVRLVLRRISIGAPVCPRPPTFSPICSEQIACREADGRNGKS